MGFDLRMSLAYSGRDWRSPFGSRVQSGSFRHWVWSPKTLSGPETQLKARYAFATIPRGLRRCCLPAWLALADRRRHGRGTGKPFLLGPMHLVGSSYPLGYW